MSDKCSTCSHGTLQKLQKHITNYKFLTESKAIFKVPIVFVWNGTLTQK